MFGTALIGRDKRQIDLRLHGRRQLALGLFGRLFEPLERHAVVAQIHALIFPEFVGQIIDDPLVKIVAAQKGVAVGRFDLKHAVADLQDGDVKRSATQVEHRNLFVGLLVQTVGQRGCGRLVDDTFDVQAGNPSGVFCGLALGVVKIGRNGDDGLGHTFAQVVLSRLLHLLQDKGRDFRRTVVLVPDFDPGVAVRLGHVVGQRLSGFGDHRVLVAIAHETFDREDRIFGIGDGLASGDLPDEALSAIGESGHRRRNAATLGIGDHGRFAAFHDRDDRVCCS